MIDKAFLENLIAFKFITPKVFLFLKVSVIFFSSALFIFICYLIRITSWIKFRHLISFSEFLTYRPYGIKKFDKIWSKITKRLESGNESEYKLAIIETDAILNEILERMGIRGETLGERLKNVTPNILPSVDAVWESHKTRNNIVHDPDYRLTLDQARKTLGIYEKALQELQVF